MSKIAILTKQIEIDFLKALSEQLEKGKITFQISKQAGKDLLAFLPFSSEEDMQKKIKPFIDKYPQLEKVYAMLLTYLDEEQTAELLEKLRFYIDKTE